MPGEKLTADEQRYADVIAVASRANFTFAESQCLGTSIVRKFGLARAKKLDFAEEVDNTPPMGQADAEKAVEALEACVNLAEYVIRAAQKNLGLTDAQIGPCALLLDQAKVRAFFVKSSMTNTTDPGALESLQADLASALPRCKI